MGKNVQIGKALKWGGTVFTAFGVACCIVGIMAWMQTALQAAAVIGGFGVLCVLVGVIALFCSKRKSKNM